MDANGKVSEGRYKMRARSILLTPDVEAFAEK